MQALLDLEARTRVVAQLDAQRLVADAIAQETNTLLYESALFRVRELWGAAGPPRRAVLALREKVFGTGRRRRRGARGVRAFDRVQWTLEEEERLVDWLGRTESEAEEEEGVGLDEVVEEAEAGGVVEDEDVSEHPLINAIKPVWLLRFFETWGVRWGSTARQQEDEGRNGEKAGPRRASSKESAAASVQMAPATDPSGEESQRTLEHF
jgi:hypothetical protein